MEKLMRLRRAMITKGISIKFIDGGGDITKNMKLIIGSTKTKTHINVINGKTRMVASTNQFK